MRKQAIASTFSSSSDSLPPAHQSQAPNQLQIASTSSFSNAYNGFFVPPPILYSTPAPSVTDNSFAAIEELPVALADTFPSSTPMVGDVLPSSMLQPFVLAGDSDTSGSSEEVSPISVPHLMWRAQIWNNDDV